MEKPQQVSGHKSAGRTGTTVGVFVEPACVRVAAVSGTTLKAWHAVPLSDNGALGTPEFPGLLKEAVKAVCPDPSSARIWACVSSPEIRVQHIVTPRVHSGQLANAVYWAITRTAPIETAENVIDFAVEAEVMEEGQPRLAVTACVVPRDAVNNTENAFLSAALRLEGVTAPIFAFRNLFDSAWLPCREETVCHVNIGDSASQISVFSGGKTALTREIKTGLHALAEALAQTGEEKDAKPTLPQSLAGPEDAVPATLEPSLTRLIRQIEQTMASSTLREMGVQVNRILVTGEVTGYDWIVDYLRTQLNVPLQLMNPFSTRPETDTTSAPKTEAEAAGLAPAVGLALSDPARTPNLLWTYGQKAAFARSQKHNKAMLAATILILLGLLGASRFADSRVKKHDKTLMELRKELAQRGPGLDQAMLQNMVAEASSQQATAARTAKRYLGVALIRELSLLTPGHISLDKITLQMPDREIDGTGRKKTITATLNGRVSGDSGNPESRLAEYSIKLADSPLIQKADLGKAARRADSDRNRLPFELTLTIADLPISDSEPQPTQGRTP